MSKLFSKEIVNKGRQIELDITRGLAVLFMILIHFQQYFLPKDYLETNWALFVDFLGGVPSAPVFMLIMGVGFVYTKKNSPKTFIKRGLMLIFAGYLLNFARGFAPSLIQWLYTGYQEYLINGINQLLYVDILQFAGLAMITFGIFKYFKLNNYIIALMGVIFATINIFLVNIKTNHILLSATTGLLWGSSELTFFPFLTWVLYPIIGYLFGSFLMRCKNKKSFYLINFFAMGLVWFFFILVVQDSYGRDIGLFSEYGYYQHTILGNIAFTGFVLWWISIWFFISEYIPRFAMNTIDRWSKNVTDIYYTQWIIIGWIVIPFGYMDLNPPYYFYVLFVVVIASDLLAHIYKKVKKGKSLSKGDVNTTSKQINKDYKNNEVTSTSNQSNKIFPRILLGVVIIVMLVGIGYLSGISILLIDKKIVAVHKVTNMPYEESAGDGTVFSGTVDILTGKAYGQGIVTYSNGEQYIGEFNADEWEGNGVWKGSDGEQYIGEFKDNEFNGNGSWKGADGDKYIGEFKDSEFNGQGTYINSNGEIESGIWENGELIKSQ